MDYSYTQWVLVLLAAAVGLGGGIFVLLRMCKREGLSFWKMLIGIEKGIYITYYTSAEKLVLLLLAIVTLGVIAIAMGYF